MENFAAIDFETANEQLSSVCSVGIVIVRDGKIEDKFYSLIQPEPNYYRHINKMVHGLSERDTDNAEVFPKVWAKIAEKLEGLTLVAHNKTFDESCLKSVFKTYNMDYPDYEFRCTLRESRRKLKHLTSHKLDVVASACGYDMSNHHHALADAEACAHIAMEIIDD